VTARLPLPPSLYAETAIPAPDLPPLDGDASADVAIIGGGITGLSAALHLAEHGAKVALLEAQEPGWGASGRNGGQVNPGLKPDPDQVEADFGPDLGRRMVALSWSAPDLVFDLIRRHQIQCEALQSGTLRAAFSPANAAGIRASAAQGIARNMPVTLLDRDAARAATGSDRYLCAMLDRRGGQLHPLSYTRGLATAAVASGAHIHPASHVLRIRRDGAHWLAETPRGTVRANRLVLAGNGYTDDILPQLRRSIVPMFSAIVASEPLPPELAAAIMPGRSVLYEMGSITVYYRLDAANRLLMGGRGPQRELARPSELDYLIAYARRLWPAIASLRWTHAWSGRLAMTPDHYPHLHEPAPGVLACLGYNGRGVAMASAMGGQVARAIADGPGQLDMPLTPLRPIPLHGLWRPAVAARVAYGRIRDALGL
jgi:glycine/D-amino acid oxidase-like deaminating enzyme